MKFIKALLRKKRPKETYFKYIILHLHLWTGLLAGIVLCSTSLSGAVYVFKEECIKWADSELVYRSSEASEEASIDSMIVRFESIYEVPPSRITIPVHKDENILLSAGRGTSAIRSYADRASGQLLGNKSENTRAFFSWTLRLHRWLLLRGSGGKEVNAGATFFFMFLLLSGLVLWFPVKKNRVKAAVKVKWKASASRLNYDLHRVLGFYSSLALILIVVTGLCFSFSWWKQGVLSLFKTSDRVALTEVQKEEKKEELLNEMDDLFASFLEEEEEAKINYNDIVQKANERLTYVGPISILLPSERIPNLTVRKVNDQNWLGVQLTDEVTFSDRGEVLEVALFRDKALFQKANKLIFPLHTGEFAGVKSKILYFLLAMISASLPVTGFVIWWNKTVKKVVGSKRSDFRTSRSRFAT